MIDETMTLADLRKRSGLSQAQIAERMGVSRPQVSRIEAMYPELMFPTLRRYMDAIEMDIRYVGGPEDAPMDVSSSEVTEDKTRVYAEGRRKDRTRGGNVVSRSDAEIVDIAG